MIPTLCDIGAERRVLPLGRYKCTLEEVETAYVPDGDDNRQEIWSAFLDVVSALRSTIGAIAEVWIGGSFITSEEHPRWKRFPVKAEASVIIQNHWRAR